MKALPQDFNANLDEYLVTKSFKSALYANISGYLRGILMFLFCIRMFSNIC